MEVDRRTAMLDAELLDQAVARLRGTLPQGWRLEAVPVPRSPRRPDALLELEGPDRTRVTLVVEAKRHLVTSDLPGVLAQIDTIAADLPGGWLPVVVSPYLSSSVRRWLDGRNVSYVDATGNLALISQSPAVYLRDRGADRDPWRGPGRPRGTLRGEPAARVVRALADHRAPLTVTGLIRLSGASTGATYRVLDFLEEEALVTRGPRGVVDEVRWRPLLERWSEDYSFSRDNAVRRFLQPRGWAAVAETLPLLGERSRHAVTGSIAASLWAPYAPTRLSAVYVEDADVAADLLGLREVDTGANVLLAVPRSDVPFQRTTTAGGIVHVAPSQAAVDLLGGPGRNPSEGQALLDWMENDEPAWRH